MNKNPIARVMKTYKLHSQSATVYVAYEHQLKRTSSFDFIENQHRQNSHNIPISTINVDCANEARKLQEAA